MQMLTSQQKLQLGRRQSEQKEVPLLDAGVETEVLAVAAVFFLMAAEEPKELDVRMLLLQEEL